MKILTENAGVLTNFEVLDFLRSRGAGKDPTRVVAPVSRSEFKVYDYLEQNAACSQTRDGILKFSEGSKIYNLRRAEVLNIINISPSSMVEIYPIIEDCEKRFGENVENLVELVVNNLTHSPAQIEADEQQDEMVDESDAQIGDDAEKLLELDGSEPNPSPAQ